MGGDELVKACRACGESKLFLDFYRDNKQRDGYAIRCKPCYMTHRLRNRTTAAPVKTCGPCGRTLRAAEFHPSQSSADGLQHSCRECLSAAQKERNRRADVAEKRRANHLDKRYGITTCEYDRLLALQGGRCAICHNRPRAKRLCVDHCHKTGSVRGLLCDWCNRKILGGARDKIEILESAVAYLRAPPTERYDWRDPA